MNFFVEFGNEHFAVERRLIFEGQLGLLLHTAVPRILLDQYRFGLLEQSAAPAFPIASQAEEIPKLKQKQSAATSSDDK